HRGGPTVLVRNVQGVEHCRGTEFVGQRLPVVGEHVGDDHAGPLVDKPTCSRRTLTTCGSGYQRDPVVESSHCILAFTVSVRLSRLLTPTEHTRHQWGPAGTRTGAAVTRYNDKISVAANVASGSRSAKYPPRRASSSAASNPSPVVSKRASTVGGDINAILPP